MNELSRYKLSTRLDSITKNKSLKQLHKSLSAQEHPYVSLVRISTKPPRKLCDLTGLPGPYTCPRTQLRYHNLSVFKYLQELSSEHIEKFFEIKNYASKIYNFRKNKIIGAFLSPLKPYKAL